MIVIKKLIWDGWNIVHITKHSVIQKEVEEVCQSNYVTFESYKGRFLVIGFTRAGRMLTVVLDPEPEEGAYYPVTARSADSKERRLYRAQKGGGYHNE